MPFLKCDCSNCGQHIEYPAEGAGQTISCPSCNQEIILPPPDGQSQAVPPPILRGSGLDRPASDAQKEKLLFFGCTFDDGITMDEASAALGDCERQFPEREKEYQARKPTAGQIKQLEKLGLDHEGMNRSEARWEIESAERNEILDYEESEDGQIDDETYQLNSEWADDYREVTRDEVARAWAHIKRKTGKAPAADDSAGRTIKLLDALEELFDDFRFKPGKPGISTQYCFYCRGAIEIELPPIAADRKITNEDLVSVSITCPHCGRATEVASFRTTDRN